MKTRFLVGLLAPGAFLFAAPLHAFEFDPDDDAIAIYAQNELKEPADRTEVEIGVGAKRRSLLDAIRACSAKRKEIEAKVRAFGVPKGDIKHSSFASHTVGKTKSKQGSWFTLHNSLTVTVATEKQFVALARAVEADEDVEILNRSAKVSDRDTFDASLIAKTLGILDRKRRHYESELEVASTVLSIREEASTRSVDDGIQYSPPPAAEESGSLFAMRSVTAGSSYEMQCGSAGFGQIADTLTIEGRYAIPGRKANPNSKAAALDGTVTIFAEGTVEQEVREADVGLSLHARAKKMSEGIEPLDALRKTVLARLGRGGMGGRDVEVAAMVTEEKKGPFIKGVKLRQPVTVTVRSEKQFETLAALVDEIPDVHFERVKGKISDPPDVAHMAAVKATQKLSVKANAYESVLGRNLRLIGVRELFHKSPNPRHVTVMGRYRMEEKRGVGEPDTSVPADKKASPPWRQLPSKP